MAQKLSASRVALLSRNPATRSKVPTAQLSAKHRAMRSANAAKVKARSAATDPEALTAPLNPTTLDAQVQASANLYAAPAEQEIAGQRAVSQHQMTVIPAWFQDYQNALSQSTQRTAQAYSAALGVQQNVANSSSALDANQRAAQQQQMQTDATARGATLDPAGAARDQQAAASRRSMLDAQQQHTAAIGAHEVAFRGAREAVGAGQKLTALTDEARRGRNIDVAAGKLALEKGQYAVKTRQDLINTEHTKQLERKAFGLESAKAAADAETDATNAQTKATSVKVRAKTEAAKLRLREAENDAKALLDAARLTNDATMIRIAEGQLKVAQQRARAYAKGQTAVAAGGVTVAQQTARNQAIRDLDGEYSNARAFVKRLKSAKARDPEAIRMILKEEFPKLPKEGQERIVAEFIGEPGGAKKGTAAKRYRELQARLRSGELKR